MKNYFRLKSKTFWITVIYIPIFILSLYSEVFDNLLFFISLVILIGMLKKTYESPVFFLVMFSSLFYIPLFLSFFFDWKISGYQTYNTIDNIRVVARIFFLFQFVLYCNLNNSRQYIPISNRLPRRKNEIVFYGILLISIFFLITALSGESILTSAYGSQEKIGTSFYEYIIPLILIAFIFSGQTRFKLSLLMIFIFIYILKDLLYGGRISSIQMSILAYILFLDKKIRFKYILLICFLLIVFLKGFEVLRFSTELIGSPHKISLKELLAVGNDLKIYGSTEGDVIYSSVRFIGLINAGIISTQDRLISFFLFLLSIFNPGGNLPPLANLSSYLQLEYPCGGGGLFPIYFFVWGGYIGIVLCAKFVAIIVNKFFSSNNKLVVIYSIMFVSTFPRWFAYNPIIILKLAMAPLYIYIFIILAKQIVAYKK